MLAAPAYLALDAIGRVPLALRDRPWPFVLFAVACALAALRWSPRAGMRARVLALAVALA